MGARRIAAYWAVAVAAALAAGCWGSAPSPDDGSAKSDPSVRKPGVAHETLFQFEAFTSAPLIGGGEVTVESLRGQVVLLDIFGTWCGPCRKSTPLMVSLYERFRDKGLAVVGLAKELTDDAAQAAESVRSFREEFKVPYRLALCPDTIWDDLAGKAKVAQVVPTVLLVDRHGVVRYLMQGYDPGEEAALADAIEKLLAEPTGPVPSAGKPSPAITRNGGSVPNIPVIYRLMLLNYENKGDFRHDYETATPKARIVRDFIERLNPRDNKRSEVKIEVELIPLVYARTCQRSLDLLLEGTELGAFVNYVKDGQVQFLPEYKDKIPIVAIEKDLLVLCRELGVERPVVKRTGFIWK